MSESNWVEEPSRLIQQAFPDGMRDDEYESVLVVLRAGLPFRAAAAVIAAATGCAVEEAYNEVMGASEEQVLPEVLSAVRARLAQSGLQDWIDRERGGRPCP